MKKYNQISTSIPGGFKELIEEIKGHRPDLNNNSEVVKEAIRSLWKGMQEKQTIKKKSILSGDNPSLLSGYDSSLCIV